MKIKTVPIEAISFDQANVRKHGDKNIAAIKASLKRFGQQKPIIVDGNLIVRAGNGTLQAATELGWREINVVESDLGAAELTAFAIADNRTAELAEWDMGALAKQLAALDEEGFDYDLLGFEFPDDHENNPARGTDGLTDPDAVPEVTEPVVKRGEIWQLGKHRLLCGDSTSKDDVDRLMAGEKADMVFTDPPYRLTGGGCKSDFGNSGWMSPDKFKDKARSKLFDVPEFSDWMPLLSGTCTADAELFVMSNVRNTKPIMTELEKTKAKIHNILVMRKDTAFPHVWYSTNTEFVLYYYFGKAKNPVKKCQSNVFEVKMSRGDDKKHVSQKPVDFIAKIIGNHNGANVMDPFLGSGSTLIACEKTGRRCFGMEIDPHYCDVIIKRWEDFTGAKAVRL